MARVRGGPALAAGTQRIFEATGLCGVPATAKSVSLNATVAGSSVAGDFRFFALRRGCVGSANHHTQLRSRLYQSQQPHAEAAGAGTGTFAVEAGIASGTVHLIVDVNGFHK